MGIQQAVSNSCIYYHAVGCVMCSPWRQSLDLSTLFGVGRMLRNGDAQASQQVSKPVHCLTVGHREAAQHCVSATATVITICV